MVAAVHIGDRAYFSALSDQLAGYDRVLYEVRGEGRGGGREGERESV